MLDIWGQYAVNLLPIYVLQVIYIYFMDHFSTTVPNVGDKASKSAAAIRCCHSGSSVKSGPAS